MNLFRLQDAQWKVNLGFAIAPLLIGMVLILVNMEDKLLHNCFSFLLILDAIANFYTILYYKRIVRRYGRNGEQILDIASDEAKQQEQINGNDVIVK